MNEVNKGKLTIYDVIVVGLLIFVVLSIEMMAKRWEAPFVPNAHISLNPINLVKYTLYSATRGFMAYFLSLIFTLVVGYAAAKNRYLEKLIIPTLDILQSVPVLGFLPGLMLALISLFPHSEIGLEFVSIIMIFTGQVWNMTFSFYQSLKSIPRELIEAARVYKLSKWAVFWNVEVPYAMPGLVWNSMMSMAGGWFFLTVCEAFTLGNKSYSVPGIGSYMALAIDKGYLPGEILGIAAMVVMIVAIDVFFWRPINVWARKFSEKEDDTTKGSIVLDILVNSHVTRFFREYLLYRMRGIILTRAKKSQSLHDTKKRGFQDTIFTVFIYALLVLVVYEVYVFVRHVRLEDFYKILLGDAVTGLRVYLSVALSIAWAVPVGILIGKSSKLSSKLQPVVQVLASFPAPLVYPWFVMLFPNLNYSSVLLMMLGTQWYILFNVIAGASTVPRQLEEATRVFGVRGLKKLFTLYVPVIFPYLITGIITAAGGAWNASIVAEYMNIKGRIIEAFGLGAMINNFADLGKLHLLSVSVIIMSLSVVLINRLVWRPLQRFAAERFSLE
ncbi:ABC transporter permease [Hippea sp. KM1]|uniref:ABC transporter permease n=1 Tax=Hippea sp. KM1 TaxID=944481 RepID=UPI00046D6710|nr:ABC transporter permease subunit [Hippea sp. KM1]